VEAATDDRSAESRTQAVATRSTSAVERGRSLFARMGCGNCHRLAAANAKGEIGPNLDVALDAHTRRSLTEQIVAPYAGDRGEDFKVMPEDFGERMNAREIDDLVTFLLASP
jgi:cytochrome c551/c552